MSSRLRLVEVGKGEKAYFYGDRTYPPGLLLLRKEGGGTRSKGKFRQVNGGSTEEILGVDHFLVWREECIE